MSLRSRRAWAGRPPPQEPLDDRQRGNVEDTYEAILSASGAAPIMDPAPFSSDPIDTLGKTVAATPLAPEPAAPTTESCEPFEEIFDQIDDASVGWMLRDQPTRNRMVFDPATVQNCFPLTSNKRTAVPFLYNITEREIIYVDVYLFGEPHASTERDGHNIGIIAKAVADRHHTKWSIYDLVRKNIHARGASGPVDTPETADITIGLGPDHTYNALQPEHLLADLL